MKFQGFDDGKTIAKLINRDDLVVYAKEIDETISKADLL